MAQPRVVLDTDIASRLFRGQDLEADERQALTTHIPVLTFVTIAEWAKWAHKRNWGTGQRDRIRSFAGRFALLHCLVPVMYEWGRLRAMAEVDGHPVPANDCWIAACCTHNQLPMLTRNRKDFDPLAAHGLTLL
jgi:predicted nucleic acid-binding protein